MRPSSTRLQRLLVLVERDDGRLVLARRRADGARQRRAVVRPEADGQHQVGVTGQRVLDVLLRLGAVGAVEEHGQNLEARRLEHLFDALRGARWRSACRCGRRTARPCPCACRPAPSARRRPRRGPPRRCWCRRSAMRFDLGASESWQMTGIFAATRSSSGVIESGLTGLTARPWKPSTITSSRIALLLGELALERAEHLRLDAEVLLGLLDPLHGDVPEPGGVVGHERELGRARPPEPRRRPRPTSYSSLAPIVGDRGERHDQARAGHAAHHHRLSFSPLVFPLGDFSITSGTMQAQLSRRRARACCRACRPRSSPASAGSSAGSESATSSASMA